MTDDETADLDGSHAIGVSADTDVYLDASPVTLPDSSFVGFAPPPSQPFVAIAPPPVKVVVRRGAEPPPVGEVRALCTTYFLLGGLIGILATLAGLVLFGST